MVCCKEICRFSFYCVRNFFFYHLIILELKNVKYCLFNKWFSSYVPLYFLLSSCGLVGSDSICQVSVLGEISVLLCLHSEGILNVILYIFQMWKSFKVFFSHSHTHTLSLSHSLIDIKAKGKQTIILHKHSICTVYA